MNSTDRLCATEVTMKRIALIFSLVITANLTGCASIQGQSTAATEDPHTLPAKSKERFAALLEMEPTAAGEASKSFSVSLIDNSIVANDQGLMELNVIVRAITRNESAVLESFTMKVQTIYGDITSHNMTTENGTDFSIRIPDSADIALFWFEVTHSTGGASATEIYDRSQQGYSPDTKSRWQKTTIFYQMPINGIDQVDIRGGLSHEEMRKRFGVNCSAKNLFCAIPIYHLNQKNADFAGDLFLDWYGNESGQSTATGTPLVPTTAPEGYIDYMNFYKVEVLMDCERTLEGWFEVRARSVSDNTWEPPLEPNYLNFFSTNHFAECGKTNIFTWGELDAEIK